MPARSVLLAVTLLATALPAEAVTVSGRVLDETGAPISGLSVSVEDILLDISQCCGPFRIVETSASGMFQFDVPASIYVVHTRANPSFNPDRERVDARSGSVTGIVLRPSTGAFEYIEDTTPIASRIAISTADEYGMATIAGNAGAVAPSSFVVFSTLETGHLSATQAASDGSFTASHFAPAGSHVQIKVDPYGHLVRRGLRELATGGEGSLSALPGTIVAAPDPAAIPDGVAFAACGLHRDQQPPIWYLEGTISTNRAARGDRLTVKGKLRIESQSLAAAGRVTARISPGLYLIADAEGRPRIPKGFLASTIMLPTGIPLEHGVEVGTPFDVGPDTDVEFSTVAADRAEASFEFPLFIPPTLSPGFYRPNLWITLKGTGVLPESPPRPLMVSDRISLKSPDHARLPIIRVGDPKTPRLIWTLLTDDLSNGNRGAVAIEDRETFGVASRIVVNSEAFVIPRIDPRSSKPIRYRLEPFAPMITLGDRAVATAPPMIPFQFPSGSLTVTIAKPDGSIETIGPAPFVQSRQRTPVDRDGNILEPGSGTLSDVYQLSTMDPRFVVSFMQDGPHRITFDGAITDVWGNAWEGHGTFEIVVGRVLSLDTAMIPGTPFEIGDTPAPAVAIAPSIPAHVELRIQWFPDSDRGRKREGIVTGFANRFGHFNAPYGVRFDEAGEYRVDVVATGLDDAGNLWSGSRTWAGVIAPKDSTLEAHGKRGIEARPEPRTSWFFTPGGFGHVFTPFHSGDVHWAQQSHATLPLLTVQDSSGTLVPIMKQYGGDRPDLDELAALGELPLYSINASSNPIHYDPLRADFWGYAYTAIERPLVRVREQNYTGPTNVPSLYWRFRSHYANQFGIGANGDLPNDFKFQFGGAVVRGPAVGTPRYGIYGSLFVLAADQDPFGGSRIMPPFQGNGGGPDGGPLFALKGREIDLFFHPTAVRPGTILHRGSNASFAGYSAPTLPSKVEIVVTSPSGQTRTIAGQANKIGYFNDPSQDFTVGESGVWKARVRIVFDGRTAAGQVTEPFPSGDVLGSRNGEFYFYVVDANSPPVILSRVDGEGSQNATASHSEILRSACNEFVIPNREDGEGASDSGEDRTYAGDSSPSSRLGMTVVHLRSTGAARPSPAQDGVQFLRPADGPITFTIEKPAGLTNAQLAYTTTMPGSILEEGIKTSMTYVYDAQKLAEDFPNLDLHDQDGYSGVDTITISFLLSGTDGGVKKHFARQIVIQGEELQMPDQDPRPKRRAVR